MNTFEHIYQIVAQIPSGKVMSYGQIAKLLNGRISAQLVGWAMRKAPEGLPCHRVVFADGRVCHEMIFGGVGIQKNLLESEGVIFKDDEHVDMSISGL